jgi:hypothetical protein
MTITRSTDKRPPDVEVIDPETGRIIDVLDSHDSCRPYEPYDRCGGCGRCLLEQAIYNGLKIRETDEFKVWSVMDS